MRGVNQAMKPDKDNLNTLLDARGRRVRYLRVSLTDRCNFRCRYCMPPEGIHKLAHAEMLTLEELAEVVRVLVERLGITKVRVTGGEPLVRKGAPAFFRAVGLIPGIRDLSLTTNAYFLAGLAGEIRAAGVRRINISLDTLRKDRFEQLTRVDGLDQVLRGIAAAQQAGFSPIKINMVIMRNNLDEAGAILRFGMEHGFQVRFIELMPTHPGNADQFVSAEEARAALGREFRLEPASGDALRVPAAQANPGERQPAPPAGPNCAARLYRIDGTENLCGFISPVSTPFCLDCDRIRLRGDGQLMPCLSEEQHFDLKPYVRPTLREAELAEFVRAALAHSKAEVPRERRIQAMWRIGG